MSDYVIAKTTARLPGRVWVEKNRQYSIDDPAVQGFPSLFESVEDAAERQKRPKTTADLGDKSMSARKVEQATAAPGEVRDVGHPCDHEGCDFVAKSAAGLGAHGRSHDGDA